MLFSFLMCVNQDQPFLDQAVDSMIAQDYKDEYEIVIVANNCLDALFEKLQGYAEKSKNIRLFRTSIGQLAFNLNYGFDQAKGDYVVRMDADTTAAKHGHQQVLDSFEALDSGILLGTQMISKGLDYHDVTLVGVLTADMTMNFPDYLAGERTYQLLEQVSGRAGRGNKPGRVIIQSYNPQHPALVAIEARNPELFYRAEEEQRQALGYPPYRNLANVVVSAEDKRRAQSYCNELGEELRSFIRDGDFNQKIEVVGPSVCVLERIANRFRFHLVLRADLDISLGLVLGELFAKRRLPADIRVVIDVDPETLM